MMFHRIGVWYRTYERHATTVAFLIGFVWDSLTLARVDLFVSNLIFGAYLLIAGTSILILHAHAAGKLHFAAAERAVPLLYLLIPFTFGSLLSGYIIFYTKSASLIVSWPFLATLVFLAIGNELFKKRYQLLVFQLSVLFITLFSYALFVTPFVLRDIGIDIFLISGIISLLVFSFLLYLLTLIDSRPLIPVWKPLIGSIAVLYILFNTAYFTNSIPPLPLSLKTVGLYHSVVTDVAGNYTLTYEKAPWYRPFEETSRTIRAEGRRVYVFSSVFAPARLNTVITHRWFYFDRAANAWVSKNITSFPIVGGRFEGYRGYSFVTNAPAGAWRIDITTSAGQIIGRISFNVASTEEKPKLTTLIK